MTVGSCVVTTISSPCALVNSNRVSHWFPARSPYSTVPCASNQLSMPWPPNATSKEANAIQNEASISQPLPHRSTAQVGSRVSSTSFAISDPVSPYSTAYLSPQSRQWRGSVQVSSTFTGSQG